MLLEQFDPDKRAVIEPYMAVRPCENFPETVVSVFSHHLFSRVVEFLGGKKITETRDVDGV